MDISLDSAGLPAWLRSLVYLTAFVGSILALYKMLHVKEIVQSIREMVQAIRYIVSEMMPAGRHTLRDEMNQTAKDSKEALELTKELRDTLNNSIQRIDTLEKDYRQVLQDHVVIKRDQADIKHTLEEIERELHMREDQK